MRETEISSVDFRTLFLRSPKHQRKIVLINKFFPEKSIKRLVKRIRGALNLVFNNFYCFTDCKNNMFFVENMSTAEY